jgi:membrane fusion protein (multidrug efflux system)
VKIGTQQGGNWVILSGLQAGEQVVVEGFQKMRPGAPVKAVAWNPGGASAPASAAASAAASAPASAAKK